jgi:hypothetical protein
LKIVSFGIGHLRPLAKRLDKIEFSFLNGNLMVPAGHRLISDPAKGCPRLSANQHQQANWGSPLF